jgi:hypothetical protein
MGSRPLAHLWSRIYADLLMPSRLDVYEDFLREVLVHGYEICSVALFWEKIKSGAVKADAKYFVLRHDVDSDLPTTKAMWLMEKSLCVKGSYYFRWTTVDVPLMQEIEHFGGEASYHFEELATAAKTKRLKTQAQVLHEMPNIRETFRRNLSSLRKRSGLPMKIVASHGDFVNRKLGLCNWEILRDDDFRRAVGVELEVYDDIFTRYISVRCADAGYHPDVWRPENPLKVLKTSAPVIYVLVHPGNWRANLAENFVSDVKRTMEGLRYSM